MHGLHARLPKNFDLTERLERFGAAIELTPERWKGQWAQACTPSLGARQTRPYQKVCLDLGCGKGTFLAAMAAAHPDTLFIGIDAEPVCLVYTAQKIVEQQLENALCISAQGSSIDRFFAPGELSCIYLNFPTPYPRLKEAHKRLVNAQHLARYYDLLVEEGEVRLRTDSLPLFHFVHTQHQAGGFSISWESTDARRDGMAGPGSEYEHKLSAQGAAVCALTLTKTHQPHEIMPEAQSLSDFLPHTLEELEALTYIPHGMQGTVVNRINQLKRQKRRIRSARAEQAQSSQK